MKNNIVSQSQFYFSAFISTLVALMFIDVSSSYQQIIYLAVALIINLFVILFYKGRRNLLLKIILIIYYISFSVAVLNKLVIFMNSATDSGPYWILLTIISVTVFFTCIKGFEALSRAAVIITFFIVLFVLYIFASTVSDIQIQGFSLNNTTSILPALIFLFPSALYASLGNTLKDSKKYPLIINSIAYFFAVGYMIFLASPEASEFPLYQILQNSTLGVFKGSDFLFLSIISIGTIYFISLAICSIVVDKQKNIFYGIPLLVIFGLSLLCLYIREIRSYFISQSVLLAVTIIMILALLINSMYERVVSQHKNCNKSKKS